MIANAQKPPPMAESRNLGPAFGLSLTAGILIVLGGAVGITWSGTLVPSFSGGCCGMMGGFGFLGMMAGISLFGLVSGVIVLAGAFMLRSKPEQRHAWGTIIIIFSAISILGMGGFLVGAILGIAGGVLGLT
ncbi:MAG: hypothetical protein LYZ66_03650 [Nitrososphaerales archaeon]|nr:hypothetical protein [Nitrososphaerales archaeon]